MARLIDADALVEKQASIAKTFARSDAQKSLMGRVMYNTMNAPTIDAIPVEWLRMRGKMYKPQINCDNPFGYVLAEWLDEQEGE